MDDKFSTKITEVEWNILYTSTLNSCQYCTAVSVNQTWVGVCVYVLIQEYILRPINPEIYQLDLDLYDWMELESVCLIGTINN